MKPAVVDALRMRLSDLNASIDFQESALRRAIADKLHADLELSRLRAKRADIEEALNV